MVFYVNEYPENCHMCPLLQHIDADEDHEAFCYCGLDNFREPSTPEYPMTLQETLERRHFACQLALIDKKPDLDLLIRCALDAGATVRKRKEGEGGIYLRGKKLEDDELYECLFNPKPMTNGDKIRAMTDEELIEFIREICIKESFGDCGAIGIWTKPEIAGGKKIPWEEWIKMEADNDQH